MANKTLGQVIHPTGHLHLLSTHAWLAHRVDVLSEDISTFVLQVWTLQRVIEKKRDQLTNALFLDVLLIQVTTSLGTSQLPTIWSCVGMT
jgi:hypothetical protein